MEIEFPLPFKSGFPPVTLPKHLAPLSLLVHLGSAQVRVGSSFRLFLLLTETEARGGR